MIYRGNMASSPIALQKATRGRNMITAGQITETCRGLKSSLTSIPVLTVTAPATSAAATKPAFLLGLGFIDCQGATVHSPAVEHGNGLLTCRFGFHFNESKTPGLTRVPVGNNLGRGHLAGLGKKRVQLFLGCVKGQIADIQFDTHIFSLIS